MTQSLWSRSMCSAGGMCFDGCTADHLPSVQLHLSPSGGSAAVSDGCHYSSKNTSSSVTCSNQMELNPPRKSSAVHLSTKTPPSPAPGSYNHHDWGMNSGHQAKRARVENIIRGITCTDGTNKVEGFTQEPPFHQKHTDRSESSGQNPTGRKGQQHLTGFRTESNQMVGEETDASLPTWTDSPRVSPAAFTDSCSEFAGRNNDGWKKVKLMNYFQSKPDRIKLMADILKYELSRAVSRSVDSIFKSMSSNDVEHVKTAAPNQEDVPSTAESQVPGVQTEALSLVVQKPDLHRPNNLVSESGSAAPCTPGSLIRLRLESAQHGERESERDYSTGGQRAARCWQDGGSEAGRDQFHTHWSSVKVKSKVNTRTVRSPQTPPVPTEPPPLESLYHPHVKLESDNLEKNHLYVLNECLTTNHLKKAKLMFFYTRYPSSLVLRMCFHDVQFTRCITSQLIKWFSNFREFYYIQMEKFARNALVEGVVDVRDLTVDRESELFRALNMHYNKANDFQVPDRFLEVAERTLREFYVAISVGKDHDPSWKKTIYKVICKLDSDVPAEFKRQHF